MIKFVSDTFATNKDDTGMCVGMNAMFATSKRGTWIWPLIDVMFSSNKGSTGIGLGVRVVVFNATFSNISVIS
jgi:hypothetical protein